MAYKYVKINIKPIIYDRDTNGDIVIDNDGNKVVLKEYTNIKSNDDYDYLITVTEYEWKIKRYI